MVTSVWVFEQQHLEPLGTSTAWGMRLRLSAFKSKAASHFRIAQHFSGIHEVGEHDSPPTLSHRKKENQHVNYPTSTFQNFGVYCGSVRQGVLRSSLNGNVRLIVVRVKAGRFYVGLTRHNARRTQYMQRCRPRGTSQNVCVYTYMYIGIHIYAYRNAHLYLCISVHILCIPVHMLWICTHVCT